MRTNATADDGPLDGTAVRAGHTPALSPVHRDPRGAGAGRLLLLEDDEALRRILALELMELGYDVVTASGCSEASQELATGRYSSAILDVGLPDGDGVALAATLAESQPDLPLALCSGRHGAFAGRSIPAQVFACLTKPICVTQLDGLLRSLGLGPG